MGIIGSSPLRDWLDGGSGSADARGIDRFIQPIDHYFAPLGIPAVIGFNTGHIGNQLSFPQARGWTGWRCGDAAAAGRDCG